MIITVGYTDGEYTDQANFEVNTGMEGTVRITDFLIRNSTTGTMQHVAVPQPEDKLTEIDAVSAYPEEMDKRYEEIAERSQINSQYGKPIVTDQVSEQIINAYGGDSE